jgi:DNA polymerase-3 subunit gamma/tau
VIAQEYRPKVLDEIIGHSSIVKEIKDRFIKKTYPQVSYFTGITGTGKTTLAYNVAKVIQCENKINDYTPCNECSFCKDINKESFIKGTYMFNASNLDIEAMRYIEELTNTTSFISDKKIIIIDEFQELSSNKKAQKNLLKALEKPMDDLYFILLSMDDSKVDKSIKNRSVMYKLYPVDFYEIAKYLYSICEKEKVTLSEDQTNILFTIAENSGGSVRQACAYLDRVIESDLWTKESLEKILHFVNDDTVSNLCLMLIDNNPDLFKANVSEEIILKMRYQLVELCKHLLGVELEQYKKTQISKLIGYKKATLPKLKSLINGLNAVYNYPYLNQEIIDTVLLNMYVDSFDNVTSEITSVSSEATPKRRRS